MNKKIISIMIISLFFTTHVLSDDNTDGGETWWEKVLHVLPFPWNVPDPDTLMFACTADSECRSDEKCCTETETCAKQDDTCFDKPDLFGGTLHMESSCFTLGSTVTLHATIRNIGHRDVTAPFDVSFYISGNNVFGDGDDIPIGVYRHTGIIKNNSHQSNANTSTFTITLQTEKLFTNTYFNDRNNYIGMKIDTSKEIDEENEENNGANFYYSDENPDMCRRGCIKVYNPFIFPASSEAIEIGREEVEMRENWLVFDWPISQKCGHIKVHYRTEDGTAVNGIDYVSRSGSLECQHSPCRIAIKVLGDDQPENDEYFYLKFTLENVNLVNPNSFYEDYHGGEYQVKGYILDDDRNVHNHPTPHRIDENITLPDKKNSLIP